MGSRIHLLWDFGSTFHGIHFSLDPPSMGSPSYWIPLPQDPSPTESTSPRFSENNLTVSLLLC